MAMELKPMKSIVRPQGVGGRPGLRLEQEEISTCSNLGGCRFAQRQ